MFRWVRRVKSQISGLSTRLRVVSTLVAHHNECLDTSKAALFDILEAITILDSEVTVVKFAMIAIMRELANESPDPTLTMGRMTKFLAGAIDLILAEDDLTPERRAALLSDVDRFIRAADLLVA